MAGFVPGDPVQDPWLTGSLISRFKRLQFLQYHSEQAQKVCNCVRMAIRLEEKPLGPEKKRCGLSRHWKLLAALGAVLVFGTLLTGETSTNSLAEKSEKCGKIAPLVPGFNRSIDLILNDPEFKKSSIEKLSGAIQIPTEIQDVNPKPADDPDYYKHFYEFHRFLEKTFPLVYKHVKVETVNELGLLYTWQGSEEDLKPVLFMAHQDVVPVNRITWDSWEYPPFSGHYDEETDIVWGRGSNDCKNLLMAELEAVEQLLDDGYEPKRTVLLSFGFDEESSGYLGAQTLAPFIEKRYGKDGIFSIIDEGFGITPVDEGVYVASPINAEKGYVDVIVTVNGKGGHSSVPPEHTTIGVAADLITVLEDHPFEPDFQIDNPIFSLLTCVAEHSTKVPKHLRNHILKAPKSKLSRKLLQKALGDDVRFRDLIRTTRAVDIFNGGIKANALPEVASFLLNHRVDIHSSVEATVDKDIQYAEQIAKKYGYGLEHNGEVIIPATDLGYIDIKVSKYLEPAPVSPSSGPVWDILAGTIQNVFENGVFANDDDAELYVSTALMSGNTDTRYYWNLTKNIYRFTASIADGTVIKTIHSVNEHVGAGSHLSAIAFIYEYIVNVDEYAKQ